MDKKAVLPIFLVVLIDLLGFGMIIPILPYYAKSYGASPSVLGWLMMSYSLVQFIFSPFWGRLSDRIGRRPVILCCILGLGAAMLAMGLAKTLVGLFVARILAGFFGANISAASAYIADVTTPENRAKGMGLIGAAFGLGFLFGPALGGLLSQFSYSMPALVASVLSLLNFVFAFFVIKEPCKSEELRSAHRSHYNLQQWVALVFNPRTGLVISLFFLVTLGIAQLETSFALFLLERFGLDAFHAGLILGLFGLIMVLIQGGGIGRLAKKFGERKLILTGLFIMSVSLFAMSYTTGLVIFIFCMSFQAVGYAITNPSLMSLVSRFSPPKMQGTTMGVYQSAGSLGRILGPIFAGYFYEHLGSHMPFVIASGFFFLGSSVVAIKGRVWNSLPSA